MKKNTTVFYWKKNIKKKVSEQNARKVAQGKTRARKVAQGGAQGKAQDGAR